MQTHLNATKHTGIKLRMMFPLAYANYHMSHKNVFGEIQALVLHQRREMRTAIQDLICTATPPPQVKKVNAKQNVLIMLLVSAMVNASVATAMPFPTRAMGGHLEISAPKTPDVLPVTSVWLTLLAHNLSARASPTRNRALQMLSV